MASVNSKKKPARLSGLHRRVMACRLRMQGKDYAYIAKRCGYESPEVANMAVLDALKQIPLEAIEELRDMELRRLDMLQDIAWKRLTALTDPKKGNLRVVGGPRKSDPLDPIPVILRIMERRAKLVGLDAPERHNVLFSEAQKISEQTGIPVPELVAMAEEIAQGNQVPAAFAKAFERD